VRWSTPCTGLRLRLLHKRPAGADKKVLATAVARGRAVRGRHRPDGESGPTINVAATRPGDWTVVMLRSAKRSSSSSLSSQPWA
jgi:hypothetical protein